MPRPPRGGEPGSLRGKYAGTRLKHHPGKFPLNPTLPGALLGSHQHHNLKAWLIVGANPPARFLASLTDNASICTFHNEDEAVQHILRQQLDSLRLAISRISA